MSDRQALIRAAANADWQQVVRNGGPPCFHIEGGRFCLRAQRWGGHDDMHKFTTLDAAIAATALEEAQGVPREPTRDWIEDASHENGRYQNQCVSCGEFFVGHKRRVACKLCAVAHAAPAAPTRETVSAATPRDEQDARRLREVIFEALRVANDVDMAELRDYSNATAIRGCLLTVRDILDAALAEPKR